RVCAGGIASNAFFFFSSRRRHTRSKRDWSSDVCSSDLAIINTSDWIYLLLLATFCTAYAFIASVYVMRWISPYTVMLTINMEPRSEERRVGKECRCRW